MGHITLVGLSASELKAKLGLIVDDDDDHRNGTVGAFQKTDLELSSDEKQPGHCHTACLGSLLQWRLASQVACFVK